MTTQGWARGCSNSVGILLISLIPFIIAAGLPIQAVCNIAVGRLLGHPFWGVAVSYWLAALLAFFLVFKKDNTNKRSLGDGFVELKQQLRSGAFEWTALLSGVLGVFVVSAMVFVPSVVGFGSFFTASVCGQIVMSLVLDYTGILWSPEKTVTPLQVVGALLVMLGTALFQCAAIAAGAGSAGAGPFIGLLAVAMGAGCAIVVQSALSRRLGASLGTPWRAVWVTCIIAGTLVTICAAIAQPSPLRKLPEATDLWMFLGGGFGFLVLSVIVIVPTYIGFSLTFTMLVIGKLISSVLVDLFVAPPLLGREPVPFTSLRAGGLAVAVGGVCVGMFAEALGPSLSRCWGMDTHVEKGVKVEAELDSKRTSCPGRGENQFFGFSEKEDKADVEAARDTEACRASPLRMGRRGYAN